MPSGLGLVHLHPASVGEPGGITAPASVRDRLSPTRQGKLQCKVCQHPHLDQGGTPPVERSSLTPLTRLIFLCDTAWPWHPLEDGEQWPVGGPLNYNAVLQLDRFCRKQGKWVEVAYVLLFFSLRGVPDLCPKAIDLGVKPLAPFCPPALPLTWSSKLSKLIVREPSPEGLLWFQ